MFTKLLQLLIWLDSILMKSFPEIPTPTTYHFPHKQPDRHSQQIDAR